MRASNGRAHNKHYHQDRKEAVMTRIMSNLGGGSGSKRIVQCGVIQSTLMNGAPRVYSPEHII